MIQLHRRAIRRAVLAALVLAVAHSSWGDDDPSLASAPPPEGYREECGACHLPYPPRLLEAAAWQRIMRNLAHHFETDASLDATTTERLSSWLQTASGNARARGPSPPDDRITRSRWFLSEHDELPADVFERESIGSAGNCAACHSRADHGDFDEQRIPR